MVFFGFVDDAGHFVLDNRQGFLAYLADTFKGKEVALSVHGRAYQRSLSANSYYWGVVVKACVTETGQAADDVHAFWCEQFLSSEQKQIEFFHKTTGARIRVKVDPRRSSKLTGTKFYDFVEECRLWLKEWLGVTTPDPDKEYWRKRVSLEPDVCRREWSAGLLPPR